MNSMTLGKAIFQETKASFNYLSLKACRGPLLPKKNHMKLLSNYSVGFSYARGAASKSGSCYFKNFFFIISAEISLCRNRNSWVMISIELPAWSKLYLRALLPLVNSSMIKWPTGFSYRQGMSKIKYFFSYAN